MSRRWGKPQSRGQEKGRRATEPCALLRPIRTHCSYPGHCSLRGHCLGTSVVIRSGNAPAIKCVGQGASSTLPNPCLNAQDGSPWRRSAPLPPRTECRSPGWLSGGNLSSLTAHSRHQNKSQRLDRINQVAPAPVSRLPTLSHSGCTFKCVQPPRTSAVRWLLSTESPGAQGLP